MTVEQHVSDLPSTDLEVMESIHARAQWHHMFEVLAYVVTA